MDGSPCYSSYLALCRPFEFSPPWSSVPADSHAYLGPADPVAALAVLAAAYTESQLIESGLAVRDATGSVVTHPFLASADVPLLALAKLHDRRVNNLMAPQGCVRPPGVSLFAVLRDAWSFKALAKNSRQLLATGDLVDTILLRSLGLAAAPIAGLETLDSHGIDLLGELCDVLEREDPGGEKPLPFERSDQEIASRHEYGPRSSYRLPGDGPLLGCETKNCCELVVVGWSVHALARAEPEATSRALQHLDAAAAMSGRDPMGCDVWVASEKSIDRMTHALQQREPRWAAKQIIESLQTEIGSLLGRRSPPRTPPADLAAASARLHQTYLDPWDDSMARERRRVALAEHQAHLEREIIAPLRRQLPTISDPIARSQYYRFVELTSLFADRIQSIRNRLHGANHDIDKRQLSETLAISKALGSLTKELAKCKRSTASFRRPR